MVEDAPLFADLSRVAGKPVDVAFDGGRLTSDAGVLVLAEIERRLGLAERLADCIEDPRIEPGHGVRGNGVRRSFTLLREAGLPG